MCQYGDALTRRTGPRVSSLRRVDNTELYDGRRVNWPTIGCVRISVSCICAADRVWHGELNRRRNLPRNEATADG